MFKRKKHSPRRSQSKRGALQISFGLLFAIIVGVVILVLALYFAFRAVSVGQFETSTATAKELGVLLNPLETGFEEAVTSSIGLQTNTRIYNTCNTDGFFGEQILQTSQESFNRWPDPGAEVSFENKYIFSKEIAEGKKFFIFSKPFEFPFKVSDLIYLTPSTETYCFLDAPFHIEDEIGDLGQENLLIENCGENNINVCFTSGAGQNCDIEVDYFDSKPRVEKNGNTLYFEGDALMYAAIFSDKEVYECQLNRLMQRTGQLALLYRDKVSLVSQKDCNTNLNTELITLSNSASGFSGSNELSRINSDVEKMGAKNERALCKLW